MTDGAEYYRRYLDGDDSAVEDLVRLYRDRLIFFLYGFVSDFDTAEELAEETFFKLIAKKPKFGARSSFKTWLYAIARNVAIDYARKNARHQSVPLDDCVKQSDIGAAVEGQYIKTERDTTVHRAMSRLNGDYRRVLHLIYFENLTSAEIAVIMKKSSRSIDTLAWRARNALKAELMKEGFIYEGL